MVGNQSQNLKDNSNYKIYYNGIKTVKDNKFLVFIREIDGKEIQIPLSDEITRHILMYTNKLVYPTIPPIERGNDEDTDL